MDAEGGLKLSALRSSRLCGFLQVIVRVRLRLAGGFVAAACRILVRWSGCMARYL